MHIVGWERDRTIGGTLASISMPSSSSSLTVFEPALWLRVRVRVRVSQPRPGGAPARQRRAPSSSFSYASAGGGIRGGTWSRHVAVGFRRRRWEPALLRGHSGFLPQKLLAFGFRRWAVLRRPGETSGAWEEGEAVCVDGTGRMSCRGGRAPVDAGGCNWKGRRRGRGK